MVRCWPYIQEYLDICKEKQDEAAAAGDSTSAGDVLAGFLAGIKGSSEAGEGDGTPVAGAEKGGRIANNSKARSKTRSMAGAEDQDEENESGEEAEKANQSGENPDSSQTDSESESDQDENSSPGNKQQATDQEGGRIPFHQTESVSEPVGGEFEYDTDYQRHHDDQAASDIDRMLERMAEKAANKQLENERIQELNDAAQSISYGNVHSGVTVHVHRINEVDEDLENQYNAVSQPLLAISKQLQRSLVQKLKDQQRGGKQTGLVMGRRLDAHALCRNDGKVFYKNNLRGLYKSASFVVQAIAFKQTGNYISHQKELLEVVSSDERGIVETFLNLKNGGTVDFNSMSETLFTWSKKWISENS